MQEQNAGAQSSPTAKKSRRKEVLKKMSCEYEARGLDQVNIDNS